MADMFGATPIPLVVPTNGEAVADRCLTVVNSFFRAVVNAHGAAAFGSVVPLSVPPIRSVFTHDPTEFFFNEKDLPALYTRRIGGTASFIAEDYNIFSDTLVCLWIWAPAQQATQRSRDSFTNGFVKLLDVMLERGVDPSWVYAGDTDPRAATRGTLFMKQAGLMSMKLTSWADKRTTIRMADGAEPRTYEGCEVKFAIEELLTYDLGRFDEMGGVDLTETTPDGLIVLDHAIYTGATFTSQLGVVASRMGNIQPGNLLI